LNFSKTANSYILLSNAKLNGHKRTFLFKKTAKTNNNASVQQNTR